MIRFLLLIFLTINLHGVEVLGKVDRFTLPELQLFDLKAKIDTGARTSSLHCMSIAPVGKDKVKFIILDKNNKKFTGKYIIKQISRISEVKSSNGIAEKRYFIKTPVIIYNTAYMMEVSLSFRGGMDYPLLIGRELLKQGFLVDVTQQNLSYKRKKEYER